MAISEGTTLLRNLFTNTPIFGIDWIIPLLIIIISMLLVTSEIQKWRLIMLPMIIAWKIAGLNISFIIWTAATILFVIEAMSEDVLGEILGARIKEIKEPEQIFKKEKRKTLTRSAKTLMDIIPSIKTKKGIKAITPTKETTPLFTIKDKTKRKFKEVQELLK